MRFVALLSFSVLLLASFIEPANINIFKSLQLRSENNCNSLSIFRNCPSVLSFTNKYINDKYSIVLFLLIICAFFKSDNLWKRIPGTQLGSLFYFLFFILNNASSFIQRYRVKKSSQYSKVNTDTKISIIRNSKLQSVRLNELLLDDLFLLPEEDNLPSQAEAEQTKLSSCDTDNIAPHLHKRLKDLSENNANSELKSTKKSKYLKASSILKSELTFSSSFDARSLKSQLSFVCDCFFLLSTTIASVLYFYIQNDMSFFNFMSLFVLASLPLGLSTLFSASLANTIHKLARNGIMVNSVRAIEYLGTITNFITEISDNSEIEELLSRKTFTTVQKNPAIEFDTDLGSLRQETSILGLELKTYRFHIPLEGCSEIISADEICVLDYPISQGLENLFNTVQKGFFSKKKDFVPFEESYTQNQDDRIYSGLFDDFKFEGKMDYIKGDPKDIIPKCSRILNSDGFIIDLVGNIRQSFSHDFAQRYYFRGIASLTKSNHIIALAGKEVDVYDNKNSDFKIKASNDGYVLLALIGLQSMEDKLSKNIHSTYYYGIRSIFISNLFCLDFDVNNFVQEIGLFKRNMLNLDFFRPSFTENLLSTSHSSLNLVSYDKELNLFYIFKIISPLSTYDDGFMAASCTILDLALYTTNTPIISIWIGSDNVLFKNFADIVMEDDYESPLSWISEGRNYLKNIYQSFSCIFAFNVGKVFCIFLAYINGKFDIFTFLQLLLINFLSIGIPAMSLALVPYHQSSKDSRRSWHKINAVAHLRNIFIGLYIGYVSWYGSSWGLTQGHPTPALFSSSIALSILLICGFFNVINNVTFTKSLFLVKLTNQPLLLIGMALSFLLFLFVSYINCFSTIFQICPLSIDIWFKVILLSLPVLLIDEVIKQLFHLDQ